MKRLIALLLCFIVASPVFAKNETDKNEFSITYGQITVPQAAYVLGGVFGSMFSLGHFSFEDAHFIGGVGVEYVHYVNDWLGFGGAVLCDYVTANAVNVAKDGTKTPNGKFNLGIVSASRGTTGSMWACIPSWRRVRGSPSPTRAVIPRTISRSLSRPRSSAWTSAAIRSAGSRNWVSACRAS